MKKITNVPLLKYVKIQYTWNSNIKKNNTYGKDINRISRSSNRTSSYEIMFSKNGTLTCIYFSIFNVKKITNVPLLKYVKIQNILGSISYK
jgi:hypothetical protein